MEWLYVVIFCLAGIFSLTASVKNWDFFFNNRKARPFVKILGRNGARIFYGVLGAFFIVIGIIFLVTR